MLNTSCISLVGFLILISSVMMVKDGPSQRCHDLSLFWVLWILAELRGERQQLCEVEPGDVASQITSPRLTER